MSEPFKFGPSARAQLLLMGIYSDRWPPIEHAVELDLANAAAFRRAAHAGPSPQSMLRQMQKLLKKAR